jgi:topoisomerase-4 subunit B
LWLKQNFQLGETLAAIIINNAQKCLNIANKIVLIKVTLGPVLPGKLVDCISQDNKYTEPFLVEGESTGRSAKQTRICKTQVIMTLRGKILNTWEIESDEVLVSQEVHDIAVALCVDSDSNNLDNLRYGKICILADADSDGLNIATLLYALLLCHFRNLVKHSY